MLVTVNDVAERLKITTRAVQIKCKQAKLKKIGNRYQITQEIANVWYNAAETPIPTPETNTRKIEVFEDTSRKSTPTPEKNTSLVSFVIAFLVLVTIAVSVMFYLDLNSQIVEAKTTITTITIENKKEVNQLSKKLNDAHDVIRNQEVEIQTLKFKDSLRIFKKW